MRLKMQPNFWVWGGLVCGRGIPARFVWFVLPELTTRKSRSTLIVFFCLQVVHLRVRYVWSKNLFSLYQSLEMFYFS